ncbi:uncharacterized protein LOC127284010 [Leptopilina boulardi]|uniref:uncharacterized protein LOC127284010 n=1 Tax=Leptopilina boulardi TaxID=63433 RepID=UPI0021F54CC2|nr:uncharacterized protein LOC127284010 [Leptopilina boulardi]
MKGVLSIFLLFSVLLAVTSAYREPIQRPRPNQPGFPNFPGQGPFNPRPRPPYPIRMRRSPEPKKRGKITIEAQKEGKKSSYNVDLGHEIYTNKHGSISVNAGVNKDPYRKPQSHVGIQGSFRF